MGVACFSAARMRGKSKLSYAVGDCSVCDFVGEVFVACEPGFEDLTELGQRVFLELASEYARHQLNQ